MDDYTPTTEEVRRQWNNAVRSDLVFARSADFDRWLASVRADAWDEGFNSGYDATLVDQSVKSPNVDYRVNPYRSEKQ